MNYRTKQGLIYFATITIPLLFFLYNELWVPATVFGFCVFMGIMVLLFPNAGVYEEDNYLEQARSKKRYPKKDYLTYYGDQLDFSEDDLIQILNRHSSFYTDLEDAGKEKFIKRLIKFIDDKTYKIHDKSGFREMPVLISSTAIQVSFGLEKYLLPHFTYIHIYPEEFIGVHPTIRFLEGNVSGNSINISWKYFLEGFQFPGDGKNVGLHEMAHAYYYQNFGPCENKDEKFIKAFEKFNVCGNKIFSNMPETDHGLYSNYAKRNFQEFWAESIELFFEKPMEVNTTYPVLYEAISGLLNQDPANKIT